MKEFTVGGKPRLQNQMTDPEFWKDKQLEAIDPCETVYLNVLTQ